MKNLDLTLSSNPSNKNLSKLLTQLNTCKFSELTPQYKKPLLLRWREHYDVTGREAAIKNLDVYYGLVPTDVLVKHMAKFPFYKEEHKSIDAWHKWYLNNGHVTEHGSSKWAVILWDDKEEPFEDGWHRLNSYLRSHDTVIPLVYCAGIYDILNT